MINYNLNREQLHKLIESKNHEIEALRNELSKKEKALDWYKYFVDFVADYNKKMYNNACEYADKIEQL